MNLDPIGRYEPLSETVYARIRSAIVERRLDPGARVTEGGLARDLGVSKTPVREALFRLREIGLVQVDEARGVCVVGSSPGELADAFETREALEVAAVRLAAVRWSPKGLEKLTKEMDRAIDAADRLDRDAFAQADAAFHLGIARLSRNRHLVRLLRDNLDLVSALRQRSETNLETSVHCAHAHRDILAALEAGDPDQAEDAMRTHLAASRDRATVEPPRPAL